MPLKAEETCLATSSTFWRLVTSSFRERISGSGWPALFAVSRTSCETEEREDRAARAILDAPALAKLAAVARPTPFDAPVMRTLFPLRLNLVGLM